MGPPRSGRFGARKLRFALDVWVQHICLSPPEVMVGEAIVRARLAPGAVFPSPRFHLWTH